MSAKRWDFAQGFGFTLTSAPKLEGETGGKGESIGILADEHLSWLDPNSELTCERVVAREFTPIGTFWMREPPIWNQAHHRHAVIQKGKLVSGGPPNTLLQHLWAAKHSLSASRLNCADRRFKPYYRLTPISITDI